MSDALVFKTLLVEDETVEPGPTFALGDHVFSTLPALPPGILEFLAGERVGTSKQIAFIRGLLTEESTAEWDALMVSKTEIVEASTILELWERLMKEFVGRPFVKHSSSGSGASNAPLTSEDASSSPGSKV